MSELPAWQLGPAAAAGAAEVAALVEARFGAIGDTVCAAETDCNHGLPVQVRALRQVEDWWVFLLLTPWMMARLFLPQRQPNLALPAAWAAEARRGQPYVVIGPALDLTLASGVQRAHINYDALLGHYLVQPLVQALADYGSADQVFTAWNAVIATRDRVMAEQQCDCPWQKEVSRREWFSRLLGGGR